MRKKSITKDYEEKLVENSMKVIASGSSDWPKVAIGQQGQQLGRRSESEIANIKDNEIHKDNLELVKTDQNLHSSFSASNLNDMRDLRGTEHSWPPSCIRVLLRTQRS